MSETQIIDKPISDAYNVKKGNELWLQQNERKNPLMFDSPSMR